WPSCWWSWTRNLAEARRARVGRPEAPGTPADPGHEPSSKAGGALPTSLMPSMKPPPSPWRTLALALLLGLAGLIAVTLWLGEPGDLRHLLRLPLQALGGALALLLTSFLAGGARLVVLLRLAGVSVTLWRATRSHVLSLFAAAVTPG